MFTGIVSHLGKIEQIENLNGAKKFSISCDFAESVHVDESIAVNGVCLTVVEYDNHSFQVHCVEESLRKTSLGMLELGSEVNLERSMTLDQGIEGHIVQGHVDTSAKILQIDEQDADILITVDLEEEWENYVVGRGSIALDGISLTVARIKPGAFTVAIIPYTWNYTNLKNRRKDDLVNLEFDIFGKYIVRYLEKLKLPNVKATEKR